MSKDRKSIKKYDEFILECLEQNYRVNQIYNELKMYYDFNQTENWLKKKVSHLKMYLDREKINKNVEEKIEDNADTNRKR